MNQPILYFDYATQNLRISNRTKNIAIVLASSWFLALSAQLYFYLPFSTVPFTAQTFASLLIASTLGSKRGLAAMVTYLLQGAIGLPFFAGGTFGLAVLTGPTSGYLLGMLISTYVVGRLAENKLDRNFKSALPAFLLGLFIIFATGIIVLAQFIGLQNAITQGLLPFIMAEALKLFAISSLTPWAWSKSQSH